MTTNDRAPTADEAAGMEWWNGLDEKLRAGYLRKVSCESAAAAWAWFKAYGPITLEAAAPELCEHCGGFGFDYGMNEDDEPRPCMFCAGTGDRVDGLCLTIDGELLTREAARARGLTLEDGSPP